MRILCTLLAIATVAPALADEGMWTFDNFPAQTVRKTYGADITPAWLDHVRLSTVRLTNCTGFIYFAHRPHSDQPSLRPIVPGRTFLQGQEPPGSRLFRSRSSPRAALRDAARGRPGRQWRTSRPRLRRPAQSLATGRPTNSARRRSPPSNRPASRRAPKPGPVKLKCQAVTLYEGGQYFIYKYKRYDDVRLVFAPEADIAAFGGDPGQFSISALVSRFLGAARLRERQTRQDAAIT